MKGKLAVFIVILVTIAVLILCWFWLQDVIEDYDLDRATAETIETHI